MVIGSGIFRILSQSSPLDNFVGDGASGLVGQTIGFRRLSTPVRSSRLVHSVA
jgi:hypothetical protein